VNESQELNRKKNDILNAQTQMLNSAMAGHRNLSASEEASFNNMTKSLDVINQRLGIASPSSSTTTTGNPNQFFAMGDHSSAILNTTTERAADFWKSLSSKSSFEHYLFRNAALGEGGTSQDGSALVPISTSKYIPAESMVECSARQLSRVIVSKMDLNLPYQSAKTIAAQKNESNNSGTNSFSTNVPSFSTTKLSAFTIGNSVTISTELLEDSQAAEAFIVADLQRAIRVAEETLFISGSGTSEPQGYLGNFTTATGSSITAGTAALGIDPILDTLGSLNRSYYANAKWLVNRQEAIRLYKAQVAASQYQVYFSFDTSGNWRLLGYPMEFSYEMPQYISSPAQNGVWLFGDFSAGATLADRGTSAIRIKVLDEVAALSGQVVLLGFRRVDQRIVLAESVIELQTTS